MTYMYYKTTTRRGCDCSLAEGNEEEVLAKCCETCLKQGCRRRVGRNCGMFVVSNDEEMECWEGSVDVRRKGSDGEMMWRCGRNMR